MRQKASRSEGVPWTRRDQALLYSYHLVARIMRGDDLGAVPEVLAPFPMTMATDERVLATGPFTLFDFRALGDGSWQVNTPFVFGTGAVGVGLVAGSLIGGSIAKSRARNAAAAAAVPRWVPIDAGMLYASQYGFYLHTPQVLRWSWSAITGAAVVAPGSVHITGDSRSGPISWIVQSDWAELLFALWAIAVHPRHPQFVTGDWLPREWLAYARSQHHLPDGVPGILPA